MLPELEVCGLLDLGLAFLIAEMQSQLSICPTMMVNPILAHVAYTVPNVCLASTKAMLWTLGLIELC